MNYQQNILDTTRDAANEAFRYLRAIPADKLEWKVGEKTRHALDIAREIAWCPTWAADCLHHKPFDWSPELEAEMRNTDSQWKTIDDCERVFWEHFALFEAAVNSIPDEDLGKTHWLPFDGGRDHTNQEMMMYPRWNLNYHTGQIAFIQLLLGDTNMY